MHENTQLIQTKSQTITGKSFASFGEIIQGRKSNGTDFLVTLPIDLWSECKLKVSHRNGPLVVYSYFEKSKKAAAHTLSYFGITNGYQLEISFNRNIPIGKGLSSSTADMLATVKALQKAFGFSLQAQVISSIFKKIEPHDGLMYNNSVAYNHRRGELLKNLNYTPSFKLIVLDFGGHIDSISYNNELKFTDSITKQYNKLYQKCLQAYQEKSDYLIAKCATDSLKLYLKTNPHSLRAEILNVYHQLGAIGIVNTHSGTCIGLIYPSESSNQSLSRIEQELESRYGISTSITQTLRIDSSL